MRNRFLFIAMIVLFTHGSAFSQRSRAAAPPENSAQHAQQFFTNTEGLPFEEYLRRIRPRRISPELKARALSLLVPEDLVTPSVEGRRKLTALRPILQYHEREDFIELKVLRVRQATVAMLAGAGIIITMPTLELLSAEELQAVVAHELAHEYFWNEIEQARNQQQPQKLREIELRCDGIALFTLGRLLLNPACLLSAIRKLTLYNEQMGIATSSDSYPSLAERAEFCRALRRRFEGE